MIGIRIAAAPPRGGPAASSFDPAGEALSLSRTHVIHLVADRRGGDAASLRELAAAGRGGVDAVQLRDKSAPAADLLDRALALRQAAPDVRLLINDRVDVALACAADGVHLAARSLPAAAARRIFPRLLGVSVHSVEAARAAVRGGADYVTFGNVFATGSKPGLAPRGIAALREVVAAVDVPVLAVGGITPENAAAVLASGCAGIAVISSILAAGDVEAAARRLRAALVAAPAVPRRELRIHAVDAQR